MFALVCFNLSIGNAPTMHLLSREMRNIENYNNIFDSKNAFALSKYRDKDYKIDLLVDKKLFYSSLYALFEQKLAVLRNYFLENLTLRRICKSISLVEASVLFVSKIDNSLRLCVNYRNFNAITLKNRHSLSFIKKTLDCLIDVVYFTKLNLKNIYYRIRICQSNK